MPAGYRPDDVLLPAELAQRDGLAYALFLPEGTPSAGSAKVRHSNCESVIP
jgi:hypothetical protein